MHSDATREQIHRPALRSLFGHGGVGLDYRAWGSVHTVVRYSLFAYVIIAHLYFTTRFDWAGGVVLTGWAILHCLVAVPMTTRRRWSSSVPGTTVDLVFFVAAAAASGSAQLAVPWVTAVLVLAVAILPSLAVVRTVGFAVFLFVISVLVGAQVGFEELPESFDSTEYSLVSFLGVALVIVLATLAAGATQGRREQKLAVAREQLEREHLHQSTLFGALPSAVLELCADEAVERFRYLRKDGIDDLASEFSTNPARRDALVGFLEVSAANRQGADLLGLENAVGLVPVHALQEATRDLLARALILVWERQTRADFDIDIEGEEGVRSYSVTVVNPGARTYAFDRLIVTAVDSTERVHIMRSLEKAKSALEASHLELGSAQAALLQAQKMEAIGVLAAGIAHEINTPIQYVGDNVRFLGESVEGLLNLLQAAARVAEEYAGKGGPFVDALQKAVDDADVEFLVEEMPLSVSQALAGISRVAEIVRAMKDFAHPGGEEASSMDINHAVSSTAIVSRNEWKFVAELKTELDPNLPLVPAFSGQLNQVLLNLVVNAAHAIGEAADEGSLGVITLSTSYDDQFVTISIADTGTGIPKGFLERVFDPFFTTKEVGKGTGQGLAIAHQVVVDRHGGRIDVETEPGVGTTFHVRLPRRIAEVAA